MLPVITCWGEKRSVSSIMSRRYRKFGDQIETLCVYAGYLMEQENWTRAEEILQQAGNCEDAEDNMNYQILKERLEEIL